MNTKNPNVYTCHCINTIIIIFHNHLITALWYSKIKGFLSTIHVLKLLGFAHDNRISY